jgi:hypothetical protein
VTQVLVRGVKLLLGAVLAVALVGGIFRLAPGRGTAAKTCTKRTPPSRRQSKPISHKVTLTPVSAAQIINFGADRSRRHADIVLSASPSLPPDVRAADIRIEVPQRFMRVSSTLPTLSAPRPQFTHPAISPERDRIMFTMCVDGRGVAPGTYAGNVIVEGPQGLGPATIAVTQNYKDARLAYFLAIGSLVAALCFLLLRGAAARQSKAAEKHGQALASTADQSEDAKRAALERAPEPKEHMHEYFTEVLWDLNWWLTSLVSLGVAAGSIIALYSGNPSWGADAWASVAAIVSPTFAAVGVQSVVTSLGKSVSS